MKCKKQLAISRLALSPPSRGAWIEIDQLLWGECLGRVAPLAGGVD